MSQLATQLNNLSVDDWRRINVIGLSGSGKSTLSRQIADELQIHYVEMDRLFHGPNWTEPPVEEFRQRIADAIAESNWVLDGNYHSKTHDLKWQRATMIIWVNTPFIRNMKQSISRAIQRAWTQQELWPGTGNRESFRKSFLSFDSVVLWAFSNYWRIQKRYAAVKSDPRWTHIPFVEIKSHFDTDLLLKQANIVANHLNRSR